MKPSEYFNSTRAKSLTTVDENGNPNVCLCGTATMPNDDTIYIGKAFMDLTFENIKKTGKATFMASQLVDSGYWKQHEKQAKSYILQATGIIALFLKKQMIKKFWNPYINN